MGDIPLAHAIAEAVRLTGLSRSLFYQQIADGHLPTVKVGRRTLILDRDLRDFLEHRRVVHGAEGA
jgi:excisionase family DNA binding protein